MTLPTYQLHQLNTWCQTFPTYKKILFAPSLQIGYNLTTALTLFGYSWTNLHITTPEAFAGQTALPYLESEGKTYLDSQTAALHMEKIMRKTFEENKVHYFQALQITTDLVETFLAAIQDARLAGLAPQNLSSPAMNPGKTQILQTLYENYNTYLSENNLYDTAAIFDNANSLISSQPNVVFAICDEITLHQKAYDFVKKATHKQLHRIGRLQYGDLNLPPDYAARRFSDAPLPVADAKISSGGHLLSSEDLPPKSQEQIHLYKAIGAENEVRGVLRHILHQKIPLDTVEIAYTIDKPYQTLLYDAAETMEIPIAFAGGIPIHLSRPGQALLGFYNWIASHFAVSELLNLCRSELMDFRDILPEDAYLSPYHVAAILHRCPITKQRHTYKQGLDRLEEDLRNRTEEAEQTGYATQGLETEKDQLDQTRQIVDHILNLVPTHPTDLTEMVDMGCAFLETFAPIRTQHDATAKIALMNILKSLQTEPAPTGQATDLAQNIRALLSNRTFETSVAKSGHLYVTALGQSGYAHRPHLFILGMDESSFPGGISEDPIFLDHEREAMDAALPLKRYRPARNVFQLIRILGTAPHLVYLTASTYNLADGRETYPAALFQQLHTQLYGEDAPLPILRSIPPPDHALNDCEFLLSQRHKKGVKDLIGQLYPWLKQGQFALSQRRGNHFTRFGGLLGFATPENNIANGHRLLSASRLETLATCPFRYFLRYVLLVDTPDTHASDPFVWLTPLDFGSLLHDVFFEFMKTLHERGETPDKDQHKTLIQEILQEAIDNTRTRIPVLFDAAFRADCKRLQQAIDIFLASESDHKNAQPVGFEVSFGFDDAQGPMSQTEPVTLSLSDGVTLKLRGRIDRVNQNNSGFEIWDYKTGSTSSYDRNDLLKKGLHLQWALYAYALEEILRNQGTTAPVTQSGYFFPSERGGGQRFVAKPIEKNILGKKLAPLLALPTHGAFLQVHKTKDLCTYCDYNRICANEHSTGDTLEIRMHNMTDIQAKKALQRWTND